MVVEEAVIPSQSLSRHFRGTATALARAASAPITKSDLREIVERSVQLIIERSDIYIYRVE
jgi:hypothetical protein